jgi:DNA polymerase-4
VGEQLGAAARGEDTAPVVPPREAAEVKSISNGMTFRRDITTAEEIRLGLSVLAEEVGERLRRRGMRAATVGVTVKDPTLHSVTRQRTVSPPTALGREIAEEATKIVLSEFLGKPIRMLTVSASGLTVGEEGDQLSLFDGERTARHERDERIEHAVDGIRHRFGPAALVRGAVLGNDIGIRGGESAKGPAYREEKDDGASKK